MMLRMVTTNMYDAADDEKDEECVGDDDDKCHDHAIHDDDEGDDDDDGENDDGDGDGDEDDKVDCGHVVNMMIRAMMMMWTVDKWTLDSCEHPGPWPAAASGGPAHSTRRSPWRRDPSAGCTA